MNWRSESCDLRDDPKSGARIIQLTSGAAISNNSIPQVYAARLPEGFLDSLD